MGSVPEIRMLSLVSSNELGSIFVADRGGDIELTTVKVFSLPEVRSKRQTAKKVMREKQTLELVSQLPHPFIVSFAYAHVDDERLFLGMELVGGGDLFSAMGRVGNLSHDHASFIAGEVALALEHMHSFDVVHLSLIHI